MPNAFETPEYWRSLARDERAFADEDKKRRRGTAESIRIHLENAAEYENRAQALEQQQTRKSMPA